MEKIIETKICKQCSVEFNITDKDLEFYEKVSPVFPSPDSNSNESGLKKYLIPTPTLCPDCRQQRRILWRNERKLYKRNCDFTGKPIISLYSPDKKYKIYDSKIWWSDNWDAMDYGRDFDFDKGFFEQFGKLFEEVPKIALNSGNDNENCDYNNYIGSSKNCYMNCGINNCEYCFYSTASSFSKDSLEINHSTNVEISGYIEWSSNVYNSLFIENSTNIVDSLFIKSSENIQNGIFCVDISNMKNVYKNQQLSESEYLQVLTKIKSQIKTPTGLQALKKEFQEFVEQFPDLKVEIYGSENCSGNLINNSKNCLNCYSVVHSEDCKYIFDSSNLKDCMDVDIACMPSDHLLDVINIVGCSSIFFSNSVFENSRNIFYSSDCTNNSSNLFGCVGLKNKQYCILNKQYTREEYNQLVPKIIEHMTPLTHSSLPPQLRGTEGEWGEFFPASISPFGYNETVAMEYYPAKITDDKKQMITEDGKKYNVQIVGESNLDNSGDSNLLTSSENIFGQSFSLFNWSLYESPKPEVSKIIPAVSLPDNIIDVPDDILNWAIECEVTGRPYRIIKQELEFYRKHNLPIPRRHPDERHLDRLRQRNPRRLEK